jgi:phage terminase small subunit
MAARAQELAPNIAGVGPAMAALTDKQRRYVHALFEAPKSHGALTFAARRAGYGTASSSRQSLSSMAHALNSDPKVQAAIAEVSQQHLTVLGPVAVRAMKRVLDQPQHRDFGRVIGIVMDRVAPAESTLTVKHDATPAFQNTAEVMRRIAELAAKFNIALPAPKVIDAIANEAQS